MAQKTEDRNVPEKPGAAHRWKDQHSAGTGEWGGDGFVEKHGMEGWACGGRACGNEPVGKPRGEWRVMSLWGMGLWGNTGNGGGWVCGGWACGRGETQGIGEGELWGDGLVGKHREWGMGLWGNTGNGGDEL